MKELIPLIRMLRVRPPLSHCRPVRWPSGTLTIVDFSIRRDWDNDNGKLENHVDNVHWWRLQSIYLTTCCITWTRRMRWCCKCDPHVVFLIFYFHCRGTKRFWWRACAVDYSVCCWRNCKTIDDLLRSVKYFSSKVPTQCFFATFAYYPTTTSLYLFPRQMVSSLKKWLQNK